LVAKESLIATLEKTASHPNFWQDSRSAQLTMQEIASLRDKVKSWREIETEVLGLNELLSMLVEERDESLKVEVKADLESVRRRVESLEFALQLSGEHDHRSAILAVKQGAGGVDAQDWAAMLMRMYLRWGERRGFKSEVLEATQGDEAGIKSATLKVDGRYAYGYLKADKGVHRLVRLSPFDADHLRHTSFALVEVLPEVNDQREVSINPDDLKIETFKASGHGGQSVQKNSSAVRLTHLPSGIVVAVQNERSQIQNRNLAMGILHARLVDLELRRQAEQRARLRGDHVSPEWGRQVRSYILHPYQMVKDHRSGYETSGADAVLDGDLDGILEAYLASTV